MLLGARAGGTWSAEFAAGGDRKGNVHAGAMRRRVHSRNRGIARIDPLRLSGPTHLPLVATSLETEPYQVTAEMPGFELLSVGRSNVHAGPFVAQFKVARPLPSLHVTVLDPRGGPTRRDGTVRLAAGERGLFVRKLVDGAVVFDTADHGDRPRLRLRMDDGEEITLEPNFEPREMERRVEFVLGTGRRPTIVRLLKLGRERLHRVLVACDGGEWRVVRQGGSLSAAADELGYGIADDRIWVQGQPPACLSLGIAVVTEQLHTAVITVPVGGDVVGGWDAADRRETIDVAAVYARFGRLPRLGAELQFALPSARDGVQWVTMFEHRRDPSILDPAPPPVWPDVVLPWAVPWRLRISGDRGVLADLTDLR
jgi:hypothetical protein